MRQLCAGLLTVIAVWCFPFAATADEAEQWRHCALFESVQSDLRHMVGNRIDPFTSLAGIELNCAAKVIEFHQSVRLSRQRLRDDWLRRRARAWSKTYCRPESDFKNAILDGWRIQTRFETTDGARYEVVADCFDALA